MSGVSTSPVAIVGYAFRLPRGIQDTDALWQLLHNGDHVIDTLPEARAALFPEEGDYPPNAGYLDDVAGFDALFFKMKGREACYTDPRQRLLLESVHHALEHAAIDPLQMYGSQTGVFVGAHGNDYMELAVRHGAEVNAYWNGGLNTAMIANRISYCYNLHGPSVTLNTACSSSLEALAMAVSSLQTRRCDSAVVAGINLILTPTITIGANRAGMLSPQMQCFPFEQRASGFVRGEGVVTLILKPLAKARADHNRIYGVIKAALSAHGGHAVSVTAPNLVQQRDLLVRTWREAAVDPLTISHIEAHGTATRLGDSIEVEALKEAFAQAMTAYGSSWDGAPFCGLGSVKANLGHLEAAAGLAGVLKVLVAMQQACLPPLAHFQEPGPLIDLSKSPLYLSAENKPWRGEPLRAGVSSFGFGGSYAHVLLERVAEPDGDASTISDAVPICLSARDAETLKQVAANLLTWLDTPRGRNASLTAIADTLCNGRSAMETRVALVVQSHDALRDGLQAYVNGASPAVPFFQGQAIRPRQRAVAALDDAQGFAQAWIADAVLRPGRQPGIDMPGYPFNHRPYWLV